MGIGGHLLTCFLNFSSLLFEKNRRVQNVIVDKRILNRNWIT